MFSLPTDRQFDSVSADLAGCQELFRAGAARRFTPVEEVLFRYWYQQLVNHIR